MQSPVLSILIPTLTERKNKLQALLTILNPQITPEVELLQYEDQGQLSIGAKRNSLLGLARGQYVAFIDDDDSVSEQYIPQILGAIKETSPDYVQIAAHRFWTINGKAKHKDYFSLHLCAIRRDIAVAVKYPSKSVGEDSEYAQALIEKKLLKTTAVLPFPVYFYNWIPNKETTNGS